MTSWIWWQRSHCCFGKAKLSLAEVLAKLAESGDENESLSDLTENDEELVGDFEDSEIGLATGKIDNKSKKGLQVVVHLTSPYFEKHRHWSFYISPKLLLELEKHKNMLMELWKATEVNFQLNSWITLKLVNQYLFDRVTLTL